MNVFDRYAPCVREYIYGQDWRSLRGVQVAAGEAIFGSEEHVLLTSSTASGKTEAAFFPIITLLLESPPSSVGCIYIGPLKALINDQFERLTPLCATAGIPVWHWHGDVGQTHKARLMKHPSGILQITPESLEALLLHRHAAIPKLFGDLRFVVIDEVHSLPDRTSLADRRCAAAPHRAVGNHRHARRDGSAACSGDGARDTGAGDRGEGEPMAAFHGAFLRAGHAGGRRPYGY